MKNIDKWFKSIVSKEKIKAGVATFTALEVLKILTKFMHENSDHNYINDNIKNVSEVDLKLALHKLHEQRLADRKQAQIDLNNASTDGFRCIKKLS